VVAFLGRKIILHWLDKDLNRYKHDLAHAAAQELETLKGRLQVAANEHSILLTRLQGRRAIVIGRLYEKLVQTEHLVRVYATMGNNSEGVNSAFTEAWDSIFELLQYFDRKQVWLPAGCCLKVTAFTDQLRCRISPVEGQAISWVGDHPIS
jgi:hypothetical protein